MGAALFLAAICATEPVHALTISPILDSSIVDDPNAAAIEGAINTATSTIDSLYANAVNVPVTFVYTPQASSTLLSNNQIFYHVPFNTYAGLLQTASASDPANGFLATALANLQSGNGASAPLMTLTAAQLSMLHTTAGMGGSLPGNAVITINSNGNFAFSGPVSADQFDAVGGLEHELDEIMGGGGGGSTLNGCLNNPNFFCGTAGAIDLYRYAAPGTPSDTTSSDATAYLSIDGGASPIAFLNQAPGADYGDFAPPCTAGVGAFQLIQDAMNCPGPYEAYTTSSPEYAMEEAIGWDAASVPEPDTVALLGVSLAGLGFVCRRRR